MNRIEIKPIVYDSMRGSTEKIVFMLREEGINVTMRNLKTNHISDR